MNTNELWSLTQWVQREVVQLQIRDLYNNLQVVVRQNTQPNQQRVAIESQKNALLQALRQINLSTLTRDQLGFLGLLGIAGYLGEPGAKNVEQILHEGALDIVTAANRLQEITTNITAALEKIDHVRQGLTNLVTTSAEQPTKADEVMLRVTFTGDASIENVVELKEWGDIWHNIARGIAMAHDQPPESVRVVGASKGSLVLELATLLMIAKTASLIILEALKVSERVVGIFQKVEELKLMHLSNKRITNDLKKEADKERREGIAQISDKVVKQVGLKKNSEGDKIVALDSAIKNLVTFLTKGGEVDCVVPDTPPDVTAESAKTRQEIAQTFKQIRSIGENFKRLEHSPDDGGDDDSADQGEDQTEEGGE
jgi:hypothetical protein